MALISFDLDGVLQQNPFRGSRPDGVFGHVRRVLAPFAGIAGAAEAEAHALELIFTEHHARLHRDDLVGAHDWDDIVATVAAGLGCTERLDIAALVTEYCDRPGLVSSYPGALECLTAVREAGHTVIALTNGFRSYQEPVVRKLGLLPLFQAMITPDGAGAGKPQAGIFRCAEAYGGSPRIHIGDVLPHDIAGAKRAGWLAIYIVQPGAPGYTELPPDLAALPPHHRPAQAREWLATRLDRDRKWHGHPPAELQDCMPDAIAASLDEVREAITNLLQ